MGVSKRLAEREDHFGAASTNLAPGTSSSTAAPPPT